ncbi:hypothetical protein BHM03_00021097 [Ensete ventricosum]|nr:hypothetical protein BHM03_00021097 [Ensete ventricosum]
MGAVPTSGHCAIGDRPCGHFIVGDHPCGHRATSGPGHWRLPLRAVAPIGDPCRNLTTPVGGLAALVVGLAVGGHPYRQPARRWPPLARKQYRENEGD